MAFNELEPRSGCVTKLGLLCAGGRSPGQLWEELVRCFPTLVYLNTWIRQGVECRGWEASGGTVMTWVTWSAV